MKTFLLTATSLLTATAALPQQSLSNLYTFQVLDHPNSVYSVPLGINNKRQVAGTFIDFSGVIHGYVWKNGTFTTIDNPDALMIPFGGTTAGGINDRGDIAGLFVGKDTYQHGYVLARPSWCAKEDDDTLGRGLRGHRKPAVDRRRVEDLGLPGQPFIHAPVV